MSSDHCITESEKSQVIARLRKEPFLENASEGFVDRLASSCMVKSLEEGETLIQQGSLVECCYFVESGRLDLQINEGGNRTISIDRLREGATYGRSCFYEFPTSDYHVVAAEETLLISLPRESIIQACSEFQQDGQRIQETGRIEPIFLFIKTIPLFAQLSQDRIWYIAGLLKRLQIQPGNYLIREGEEGDQLFFVEKGSFAVFREKAPEKVLANLTRGAIVGEMALIGQTKRNASVKSIENATVLSMHKDDFLKLLKEQENLFKAINQLATVRQAENQRVFAPPPKVSPGKEPELEKPEEGTPEKLGVDLPPPFKKPKRKKKYPIIKQHSQMDCGAACLSMVTTYYGCRQSLNPLREMLKVGHSGASMANLLRVCKELGFQVLASKSTWDELKNSILPAITNWQGYHWIVVYEVGEDKITIGDPERGKMVYSRKEFEEGWTRYTVFMTPGEDFYKLEPSERNFKRFIPYVSKQVPMLSQVMLGTASLQFMGIFLPLLSMYIIDTVMMKGDKRYFPHAIGVLAFFTFLQIFLGYFRSNLSLIVGRKISLSVMEDFLQHLLHLPLKFFERRKIGDITTRVDENEKITNFLTETGFKILLDLITAFFVSILFWFINPLLLGITLAFVLLDISMIVLISPKLQQNFTAVFTKMVLVQSQLIEALKGMRTVKSLGIGPQIRSEYESLYTSYQNESLKGEVLREFLKIGNGFSQGASQAALLFTGAFAIFAGKMSIGELVAFQSLVGYVRDPLVSVVSAWDVFQEALNAVERVGDIYDSQREQNPIDRDQLLDAPPLRGDIQFKNVTFRYEEDAQDNILQNLRFGISPGQKVAFVGRSGSGKSTTIKLIFGYYPPNSGQLLIDGFHISDLWLPSLREQIGVVLQEDFMFEGTIRENIARGKPNANFSEILEAARKAGGHDFISKLPEGYETQIAMGGANLSGGQRQRISLARTFLQDPQILIMDEATSALDNETERFVMENIYEQFRDKTVIMIAHRLSTVRKCDQIFVFERGGIIENGTHEELMDKQGMYFLLSSKQ